MDMTYRRLGGSGLEVSVLSFGSWVTFGPQVAGPVALECLDAARNAGVNFFDNAESYGGASRSGSWGRPSPSWPGPATAT